MTRIIFVVLLSGCAAYTSDLERAVIERRAQMTPAEAARACAAALDERRTSCVWIGPVNHDCDRAKVKVDAFCY